MLKHAEEMNRSSCPHLEPRGAALQALLARLICDWHATCVHLDSCKRTQTKSVRPGRKPEADCGVSEAAKCLDAENFEGILVAKLHEMGTSPSETRLFHCISTCAMPIDACEVRRPLQDVVDVQEGVHSHAVRTRLS